MTKLINRNTVIPTKKSQVGGRGLPAGRAGPAAHGPAGCVQLCCLSKGAAAAAAAAAGSGRAAAAASACTGRAALTCRPLCQVKEK